MADTEEISRAYRSVNRALDRVILPVIIEQGLTMAQFKALLAVGSDSESGMAVGALACELGIAQPTASALVERLTVAGLVRRGADLSDRRRVLLRLTNAGERLVAELRSGRRRTFETWLARMTPGDLDALQQGLVALAVAAHAEGMDGGKPDEEGLARPPAG